VLSFELGGISHQILRWLKLWGRESEKAINYNPDIMMNDTLPPDFLFT